MDFAVMMLLMGDLCHQKRAVVVQQPVAYQQVYYFVGAPLRQQAVVQKQLADDPLYQEFLQFKAWKEQTQKQPVAVDAPEAKTPITAHCGRCHGGASPKGGFFLDGQNVPASDITKALRQIADGSMPPDRELTAEEKGALMQALLNSEDSQ